MSYNRNQDKVNGMLFLIAVFLLIAFISYSINTITDIYFKTKRLAHQHYVVASLTTSSIIFGVLAILFFYILIKTNIKIQRDKLRKAEFKKQDTKNKENQWKFINDENVIFTSSKPINREAYNNVFEPIDAYLKKYYKYYRIIAETTLGAFIKPKCFCEATEKKAKSSINSKRIDFLIIDALGHPALAVEYHGKGHYGTNPTDEQIADIKLNDKIKAKALELAEIKLVVIEKDINSIKQGLQEVRKAIQYYDSNERQEVKVVLHNYY